MVYGDSSMPLEAFFGSTAWEPWVVSGILATVAIAKLLVRLAVMVGLKMARDNICSVGWCRINLSGF
jgi:hypothetical protein